MKDSFRDARAKIVAGMIRATSHERRVRRIWLIVGGLGLMAIPWLPAEVDRVGYALAVLGGVVIGLVVSLLMDRWNRRMTRKSGIP
jgi:hypothetical protein